MTSELASYPRHRFPAEIISHAVGTASKLGVPGRIDLSNEARVWNPAIHRVGPERGDSSHPQLRGNPLTRCLPSPETAFRRHSGGAASSGPHCREILLAATPATHSNRHMAGGSNARDCVAWI